MMHWHWRPKESVLARFSSLLRTKAKERRTQEQGLDAPRLPPSLAFIHSRLNGDSRKPKRAPTNIIDRLSPSSDLGHSFYFGI